MSAEELARAKMIGRFLSGALEELHAEGWRSTDGVEACSWCGGGTTSLSPSGLPRHLRCPERPPARTEGEA